MRRKRIPLLYKTFMPRTEEKDMHDNLKRESGVTLIELLVAMIIIGIMSSLAYLSMDYVRRERLSSATRELVADIQQARVDALISSSTGTMGMGSGIRFVPSSSYILFAFNDANLSFAYDGTGEEANPKTRTISSQLSLQIQNTPGDPNYTVLMYDRTGMPKRYKADGTSIAGDMVIVLSDGTTNNTKCISVTTNAIREGVLSGTTCVQQ